MKIALDVDDTISAAPEFFAAFSKAMRRDGHEIHIVTAFDETWRPMREKELKDWGIEYDNLAFTPFKEEYCKQRNITIAFDDCAGYYNNSQGTLIKLFKIKK